MIQSADLCPKSHKFGSAVLFPEEGILLPGAPADEMFCHTGDAFSWRAVRHKGPREGTTVLCWRLRTGEESGHGSPGERRAKHRALARLAWRELEGTLRKVSFTKSHPTGSQWDFPGCVQYGTGEAGNEPGKGGSGTNVPDVISSGILVPELPRMCPGTS